VEWSACAAAEPADDTAAALHEQKKVASREADAARRRPSRAADSTATLRCVWSGLCAARCVICIGQAAAYVLCLVAPEMSGGPSLRCQYGLYINMYGCIINVISHREAAYRAAGPHPRVQEERVAGKMMMMGFH